MTRGGEERGLRRRHHRLVHEQDHADTSQDNVK
jgi:hypothetical protein